MAIDQEWAAKTAEADAALGVAHEALMTAQGLVTAPPEAVDALTACHAALDLADEAVEALGGLVGMPSVSALGMTIREAVGHPEAAAGPAPKKKKGT